jgi:hypothetical protein
VHDEVCAVDEGVLEGWWGEGGIDDEVCAAGVGFACVCGDVEGCAFGVDGGFKEDYISGGEVFGGTVYG